ncbi:MAG: thiamine diphosphokinase [Actinobacteria bacterium]|nr:thiamine diphosphokinase [Actinomycetota bacterium]
MTTILVFAGGDPPPPWVVSDLPRPDLVVAADGGHDHAVALGYAVDVLVGDLDSLRGEPSSHVVTERHPADKEATDLELALELVTREWPERVVVVGGGGGRLDHELATASLIASPRWAGIDELDWVTGRGRAHVVRGHREVHSDIGTVVTLLPCGGDVTGVHTTGLRWELRGETLLQGSTRGVSNVAISPVVDIRVGEGTLLTIFPAQPSSPEGIAGSSAR